MMANELFEHISPLELVDQFAEYLVTRNSHVREDFGRHAATFLIIAPLFLVIA